MLVDTISQDVRTELPWELLYADDLAIIDVTSTDTQNRLESWQKVLTDNGLKINVAKTEHLSTRGNPLPMKLNGEELKNVDHFKYLGSMIDKDGTIDRDMDLRVQAAQSSRRKLTRVLYDRKIPLRLKAKIYETIIRPARCDVILKCSFILQLDLKVSLLIKSILKNEDFFSRLSVYCTYVVITEA